MKILLYVFFTTFFIFSAINFVEARSGCCSHHGGVCGCGCCDGSSLSSTCAPYYPECNKKAPEPIKDCPKNSYLSGGNCYCNAGYEVYSPTGECLTPNESCTKLHGPSIYKSLQSGGSYCDCLPGYEEKLEPYYDSIEGNTLNMRCTKIQEPLFPPEDIQNPKIKQLPDIENTNLTPNKNLSESTNNTANSSNNSIYVISVIFVATLISLVSYYFLKRK